MKKVKNQIYFTALFHHKENTKQCMNQVQLRHKKCWEVLEYLAGMFYMSVNVTQAARAHTQTIDSLKDNTSSLQTGTRVTNYHI